jgi:putative N6-adenine-specific DNA methylase
MQQFELIVPCHFGMESVVKNEIYDLGYDIASVDDGRVSFIGDAEAIVRANINLRTAERVLLKVGSFRAETWEDLFQGTLALPWEEYLPRESRFWVTKAASVKSRLFSPSDIQSVMKKAMVERMKKKYLIDRFPETGASYPVRVFIKKDEVTCAIDTTGDSLHKRGYRLKGVKAPIAENLAAGLLMLTPWKPGRILVDPFCGSGTFIIEAAMIAAGIAPGLRRHFTAEEWTNLIPSSLWTDAREEAEDQIDLSVETDLQGYDIDPAAIQAARENARLAGVEKLIHFQTRPVDALSHPKKYGFIVTNPPYGERLSGDHLSGRIDDADPSSDVKDLSGVSELYKTLGDRFRHLDSWSMYVITSYDRCEQDLGLKAAKNRKIYNGMLKTYFYMFPGPRPQGRRKAPAERIS